MCIRDRGNAIKFTERGAVVVSLAADPVSPTRLSFGVHDTGIGMSNEAVEHLFQPFSQADSSHARRFGGTGLGLAIVRQIASSNGWTVELRPRPGGGTAACVWLPLEEGARTPGAPRS